MNINASKTRNLHFFFKLTYFRYGNLFYKYHTNDSRFDHSDVVGPLATLIKVKDPKWNYAVQIAGGQNVSI